RLELLPHAAADTDHPTRVAGARQAVDQLVDAIRNRVVTNLKGDLLEGYASRGARTPVGIGHVTCADVVRLADSRDLLTELRAASEAVAAVLGALDAVSDAAQLSRIIERYRPLLANSVLKQHHLLKGAGLLAPP